MTNIRIFTRLSTRRLLYLICLLYIWQKRRIHFSILYSFPVTLKLDQEIILIFIFKISLSTLTKMMTQFQRWMPIIDTPGFVLILKKLPEKLINFLFGFIFLFLMMTFALKSTPTSHKLFHFWKDMLILFPLSCKTI